MCLSAEWPLRALGLGRSVVCSSIHSACQKTLFANGLFCCTLLLWALSANAQAFTAQEDFKQSLNLEFLPAKRDLTPASAQALKGLFSRFSQVQELTIFLEEDGSYLEALCEARASALLARVIQMGAPRTQTLVSCPAPKVPSAASGAFPSSVLNARGVATQRAGAWLKEETGSRGHKKDAPKTAQSLAALEDPLGLKPAIAKQFVSPKERQRQGALAEHASQASLSLSKSALNGGETLGAEKQELDEPGLKEKKVPMSTQDMKRIAKGHLLHTALQGLAESQGWTLIWYPNVTWRAIADIDLTLYPNAQSAVTQLVGLLRLEGKPIQLRVSEGNKVMEILSTQVNSE